MQIFWTISWNLSEIVSGKQCSFNLSIFLFLFFFFFFFLLYWKVSEFFQFWVFFKVLFRRILGWIFFQFNFLSVEFSSQNFSSRLSFYLLGSFIHETSDEINLQAYFSYLNSSGPQIRTEDSISSSWQKGGSHILVPHCLGLHLLSPLWPKSSAARGRPVFSSK